MVDFLFTGTKESISLAKLLIDYHLKHLVEMDQMRESVEELNRKLHPRGNTPVYNGYSNGRQNGSESGGFNRGLPPRRNGPPPPRRANFRPAGANGVMPDQSE